MFFNKWQRAYQALANKAQNLEQHNQQLHEQIAELEAQLLRTHAQVQESQQEHKTLNGIAANLGNFGSSLEGVSESFRELVSTLNQQQETAQQAASKADENKQSFHHTAQNLAALQQAMQHASQNVESLNQRADEISDIVQLITDVASQTNLLALNAAIEAARAGQAGRGFAVVADEVRKLAERTAKATTEITSLVKTIQEETRQACQVMEKSASEARTYADDSQDAVLSMQSLHALSQQIEDRVSSSSMLSYIELANIEELGIKLNVYKVFLGISKLKSSELPDEQHCRLGKWYYSEGQAKFASLRSYQQLEEPHRMVHRHAKQALDYYYAGEMDAGLAELAAMEAANNAVMMWLKDMLNETRATSLTQIP